jgi:antimicrobial peptide system SdpA family protein
MRFLGSFVVLLTLVWSAVVTFALYGSLRFNPLSMSSLSRVPIETVAPQGWKFFTKDPQEPYLRVFTQTAENKWTLASLGANAEPHNLLGVSRAPRARGVEFGLLVYQLPESAWRECDKDPLLCLDETQTATTTEPYPVPRSVCGTVGLVMSKPVPWAWASLKTPFSMPSKTAKVFVPC